MHARTIAKPCRRFANRAFRDPGTRLDSGRHASWRLGSHPKCAPGRNGSCDRLPVLLRAGLDGNRGPLPAGERCGRSAATERFRPGVPGACRQDRRRYRVDGDRACIRGTVPTRRHGRSVGTIQRPGTHRLGMSSRAGRRKHVRVFGPIGRVASRDQVRFGTVATNSGITLRPRSLRPSAGAPHAPQCDLHHEHPSVPVHAQSRQAPSETSAQGA